MVMLHIIKRIFFVYRENCDKWKIKNLRDKSDNNYYILLTLIKITSENTVLKVSQAVAYTQLLKLKRYFRIIL